MSIFSFLAAVGIIKLDRNYNYIYFALFFRIISIISVAIMFFRKIMEGKNIKDLMAKLDYKQISIILFFALLSRFIFLDSYPFFSIGDEVRDGGVVAFNILSRQTKNFFDYGYYNGYGLGIPLFTSFFYRIFGSSVLTYRFPAAIISVFDILMIYGFCLLNFNKKLAFWSSLILIASSFHLYLSRTEIVVILDCFLTSLILLSLFSTRNKNIYYYVFLGLVLGFSMGFHAAVRVVALISLIYIIFSEFIEKKKDFLKKSGMKMFLLIVFVFVGIGPRICFSSIEKFAQRNKSVTVEEISLKNKAEYLGNRYWKSLLVWVSEPLQSRSPEGKPIYSPILSLFFLLGIFSSIFIYKSRASRYLFFLSLFLPLTNSALTDSLNLGQRVAPLIPVGAILASVGIVTVLNRLSKKQCLYFEIFLFGFLLFNLFCFFLSSIANKTGGIAEFTSTHLIRFLKKQPLLSEGRICLKMSPGNFITFDLMHYKEQFSYFLPKLEISMLPQEEMLDNEIKVYKGTCPVFWEGKGDLLSKEKYQVVCPNSNRFLCPLGYQGVISIKYYQK